MNGTLQSRLHRVRMICLVVGVVALGASVMGAFVNSRQFFLSYLFSYLFWLGLSFGCLIIAMIHYLTGGAWGHPTRRFLEAGFATLPVMALLFVPILFGLRELYPWARSSEAGSNEVLREEHGYLNVHFFVARAIIYFAVWLTLVWLLRKWSLEQDATDDPAPTRRMRTLSGAALVIFPIVATFAFVDWIMSLEAKWYSTVFAVIMLAGEVLVAYAFMVILLRLFEREPPFFNILSPLHFHQLGNLILTFVLFWTYVSFGQLLIIYSANNPEEIAWYLHRINGGWVYLLGAIAAFHFFLPFLVLLFRNMKRRSDLLSGVSVCIFVINLVYMYWVVTPSMFPAGIHVSWLDVTTPVGIGGIWFAMFFSLVKRAPLMPVNDPRIKEEMAYAGK